MLVKLKSYTLSDYYFSSTRYNIRVAGIFPDTMELNKQNQKSNNRTVGILKGNNKKKHFSRRMLAAVVLLVMVSCIIFFTINAYGSPPEYYEKVVVGQGDSLWIIAKKYCGKGTDIRFFINEIIEINGIEGDYIFPGMVLKIPVR